MFFSHRRILSLPVSPGSLSFQSSRKGTPTYSLFPHLFIVAQPSHRMSKWNSTEWEALCSGEACPICRSRKPRGMVAELNATYLTSSPESLMGGYCCLVLKRHAVELYELGADEAYA